MNVAATIHRAFASNLKSVSLTGAEQAALQADGIVDPTLQRYVVWRRATVVMVVLATFLSAAVSAYRTFTEPDDQPNVIQSMTDDLLERLESVAPGGSEAVKAGADKLEERESAEEPQTAFADFEHAVHLIALWLLPLAALATLLLKNKFSLSYRILVAAFVFSFFVPIFFALCPWSWWGYKEAVIAPGKQPDCRAPGGRRLPRRVAAGCIVTGSGRLEGVPSSEVPAAGITAAGLVHRDGRAVLRPVPAGRPRRRGPDDQ
jgi:hypothetical protein